mgnify:CR=1 FL=1
MKYCVARASPDVGETGVGALATTELAMKAAGVPFSPGVNAAIDSLSA